MIGTVLQNRYRLDAELGRGGMGVVYRAYDLLLERPVAVKLLTEGGLGTAGRARLLREARAVARLNHPNIVSVFDAGEDNGRPFIVMELLQGDSLNHRRPETLAALLAVLAQVCTGLEHAHAHGVVHRDLKPENVFLTTSGLAKLTDFGLAHSPARRITTEGTITGTFSYLAPEQARGDELDGRADLYSFGVMLYELAAGRLPFASDNPVAIIAQHLYAPVVPPSAYRADLPPALDTLAAQLLAKQPDDRPASAADVRAALDAISAALAGPAAHAPAAARSPLDRLARGRLVGRDREFAEARALWQQALAGHADQPVLLISGESGAGKTPLVRELRALAEITGATTFYGECYPEGSAPYAPIARALHGALELVGATLPRPVLAELVALAPDLPARYPDVPRNPPLDPPAEQQRLFESVVAACAALAARTPVLLIVEDVQWADSGTLFLLRHLARRGRAWQLRLLVVLTYREGELDETRALNDVLLDLNRERLSARIKVARFDLDQTRAVLAALLQAEVSPEFAARVYRETEGNLFFIEEVCKALVEEGKLCYEDCHWRVGDLAEIDIPQSVRLALQSRVAKLPVPAQETLRLAAVIGREFDFEVLRHASELDEDALIDALETAARAQLIAEVRAPRSGRGSRTTFAFAHALTLVTLRESASGPRRHRMHRRVAAAVAAARPDDDAALAYHYAAAGDEELARRHYRRAGDRAAAVHADQDALDYYTRALEFTPADSPEHAELLAAQARVAGSGNIV